MQESTGCCITRFFFSLYKFYLQGAIKMYYDYDIESMRQMLKQLLGRNLSAGEFSLLCEKEVQFEKEQQPVFFNLTFTAIPRMVKKNAVVIADGEAKLLAQIRKNFSVSLWTIDRLVRCWWLLQLPVDDKMKYSKHVESLFLSAEMNEQVALYGSLPLLAYPEAFRKRASEGLRTNIRSVFEAIALDNPYPSEYFDEHAWNQMVLKAFFMDVSVNRILGMDQRANATLAHILSDYAHERWAAGRTVNALLWRPVSKFIDENILTDMEKLFQSEKEEDVKAAMLACSQSNYGPAIALLGKNNEHQKHMNALTWESLER